MQRVSVANLKVKSTSREADEAFEACFQQYWSRITGVLYRMVGDPDEAEDLALETFWQLYRQVQPVQSPTIVNPGGWLYRVAVNLGYNALRSRQRRRRYEGEAGQVILVDSNSVDPADEVEQIQQRQAVRLVLSRMKKRSAQILILRHAGLSYVEVAEALKIQAGSVGKLLARAEREFEQIYKEGRHEEYPYS